LSNVQLGTFTKKYSYYLADELFDYVQL